jgi:hypothetical protein
MEWERSQVTLSRSSKCCNGWAVAAVANVERAGRRTDKTSTGLEVDIVRSIRAFLACAGPAHPSADSSSRYSGHLPGCREVNLFVRQRAANKHHGNTRTGPTHYTQGTGVLGRGADHIGFAYLIWKRILAEPNVSVNAKDLGQTSTAGTTKTSEGEWHYQVLDGQLGNGAVHAGDLRSERLNKRLKIFLCRAVVRVMRYRPS